MWHKVYTLQYSIFLTMYVHIYTANEFGLCANLSRYKTRAKNAKRNENSFNGNKSNRRFILRLGSALVSTNCSAFFLRVFFFHFAGCGFHFVSLFRYWLADFHQLNEIVHNIGSSIALEFELPRNISINCMNSINIAVMSGHINTVSFLLFPDGIQIDCGILGFIHEWLVVGIIRQPTFNLKVFSNQCHSQFNIRVWIRLRFTLKSTVQNSLLIAFFLTSSWLYVM